MFNRDKALVFDIGSLNLKFGYAGEDYPTKIVRSVVGKDENEVKVGKEVLSNKNNLKALCPIWKGVVSNWDLYESIFSSIFYSSVKEDKSNIAVLVTEPCLNAKSNRERLIKLIFENFNQVSSFYLSIGSVLSLYSCGRTTGLVVSSGHSYGEIIPIYEGYPIPHACERDLMNGYEITESLLKSLENNGYKFKTEVEKSIIENIKEKHCFLNLKREKSIIKVKYVLPNNNIIYLTEELYEIPEKIFNSDIKGKSLHEMVFKSMKKCNIDMRGDLKNNILLSGGNTLIKNFHKRFEKEMLKMEADTSGFGGIGRMRIIAPKNRQISSWHGGSILTSLSTFQSMWIDRCEYDDAGPPIVHRKCF